MEEITFKWFAFWYIIWAVLFSVFGVTWLFNPGSIVEKTLRAIQSDSPPDFVVKLLKYTFFFSLASIILAFFPFRLAPLLFSIWVMAMVFILGRFLVRWDAFSLYWNEHRDKLDSFYRKTGAFMTGIGLISLYLCYQLILFYNV